MQAIQKGHLDLLGTLFSRYASRVFGRCFQLVRDRAEADDLLQEAFLRVLRYRASFRATARFSSWLYQITTNVCFDHLEARKRDSSIARELARDLEENVGFDEPDSDPRIELLRSALERLAPEPRELLTLVRLQGYGYAQLAERYGASEGAIRVRVHRALKELKSIAQALEGTP